MAENDRHFDPLVRITGIIGQLVANDTKVLPDTLVQLFCLPSSGLIGSMNTKESE